MRDWERREVIVASLLPFYLQRFHSSGAEGDTETLARRAAFEEAGRVMAESDKREKDGL